MATNVDLPICTVPPLTKPITNAVSSTIKANTRGKRRSQLRKPLINTGDGGVCGNFDVIPTSQKVVKDKATMVF